MPGGGFPANRRLYGLAKQMIQFDASQKKFKAFHQLTQTLQPSRQKKKMWHVSMQKKKYQNKNNVRVGLQEQGQADRVIWVLLKMCN